MHWYPGDQYESRFLTWQGPSQTTGKGDACLLQHIWIGHHENTEVLRSLLGVSFVWDAGTGFQRIHMILRSTYDIKDFTFSKIGKILFLLKLITCPGIFINFALTFFSNAYGWWDENKCASLPHQSCCQICKVGYHHP